MLKIPKRCGDRLEIVPKCITIAHLKIYSVRYAVRSVIEITFVAIYADKSLFRVSIIGRDMRLPADPIFPGCTNALASVRGGKKHLRDMPHAPAGFRKNKHICLYATACFDKSFVCRLMVSTTIPRILCHCCTC